MTARLLGRFDPGSPEWLAARRNRIGGSEISAVLGLSQYESRFSLWHRKAGLIGPQDENDAMHWGKRLEGPIADEFAERHEEYRVVPGGLYQHAERDYQVASPDRGLLEYDNGRPAEAYLECKNARFGDDWGTDTVPIGYKAQCLWTLDTLGLSTAYLAVLIGGCDYREYVIRADPAQAAYMRKAAEDFLGTLARGERPDIDGDIHTYEAIRELHPAIDGSTFELDVATAARYLTAKAELKAAEWRESQARGVIADQMGEAQRAVCNGHKILRRQARGGGLPYLVACNNLPDPDALTEEVA